jgi:hypothetical protein
LYGFEARAEWLRGRYYWTSPSASTSSISGGQFFGKTDDKALFSSTALRSHEWELQADILTWADYPRAMLVRPYIGYGRSDHGWTFKGQEVKDGQIDVSWKTSVPFVGIAFEPRYVRLSVDYGWPVCGIEGSHQKESAGNSMSGTLRGHRWRIGARIESPIGAISDQFWLDFGALYERSQSSGEMNFVKDKETATGGGSLDSQDWRVTGGLRASF